MDVSQTLVPVFADAFRQLAVVGGWVIVGFVGLLGLMIIVLILRGRIDLTMLISEDNGAASLSRFQLLVFTFVISLSLFYIIASTTPPAFPSKIPPEILGLLGISAGSYVISKGIQKGHDTAVANARPAADDTASTTRPADRARPQSITLSPANPAVQVGNHMPLIATGTYADGSTKVLTDVAHWASDTPAVATVNTRGVATGVAAGTAIIIAVAHDVIGTTRLTVNP
jgi:hypothetical protein